MENFPPWCFLSVYRATKSWLLPGDHAGRLRFSEKLQPRVKILPGTLLTDEAHCTQDGIKQSDEVNYQYNEFAVLGTERLHTMLYATVIFC
jgi:hypothetical protein